VADSLQRTSMGVVHGLHDHGVRTRCKPLKRSVSRGGHDDVVHIKKYVGKLLSMAIDEEGHV
jgi:hypothetical protein